MIENLSQIYEINEFRELLDSSEPIQVQDIDIDNIYAYLECGDYTFYIKNTYGEIFELYLDSSLSRIEEIFEFLESIYFIKNEIAILISSDGPEVTLYAKYIDENNIRFFISDTCKAYDMYVKDVIEDFSYKESDIRYDVIIDKKLLIRRFCEKLVPIFIDYDKVEVSPWGNEIENLDEWLTKLEKLRWSLFHI